MVIVLTCSIRFPTVLCPISLLLFRMALLRMRRLKVLIAQSRYAKGDTRSEERTNTIFSPTGIPRSQRNSPHPSIAEAIHPLPSQIIDLNVFFNTMDNGVNRAMFNNITYNTPVTPSLLTELNMGENAGDVRVYGTNTFVLHCNEVVKLRVFNWDVGEHPLCVSLSSLFLPSFLNFTC